MLEEPELPVFPELPDALPFSPSGLSRFCDAEEELPLPDALEDPELPESEFPELLPELPDEEVDFPAFEPDEEAFPASVFLSLLPDAAWPDADDDAFFFVFALADAFFFAFVLAFALADEDDVFAAARFSAAASALLKLLILPESPNRNGSGSTNVPLMEIPK